MSTTESKPESEAIISVEHVSKAYRLYRAPIDRLKEALSPFKKQYHQDFYALNDVSIEVAKGECVGIIGLNGSGKSTLLQVIAGVLTPSSGQVKLNGKIAALLELGAGFNPDFSGMENIYFQCTLMGYQRDQIKELLPAITEFADIGTFIEQPVKTYSSGMYVRLAFSVAINVDPDILIVDEALAVGDIRFQAKCMAKIREFRRKGKALLFVSHDASAVKTLCNKAYLLDRGRVIDQGEPDQVFNYYNSLIAERDLDKATAKPQHKMQLRQRSGNGKVRIERVSLLSAAGEEVEVFVSGANVTLALDIHIHHDVSSPSFGVLLRDRLGNDIFGINNHLLGIDVGSLQAGTQIRITYEMPLNIGEGIFTVTVAAHAGEAHVEESYDWLNEVLVFRVIHSPDKRFTGAARLDPVFNLAMVNAPVGGSV